MSDLEDEGLVFKKDGKENFSLYYFEPNKEKQKKHKEKVNNEKFEKWLKKGSDFREMMGEGMYQRLVALTFYRS